jgi:transposase-like protein
MNAFVKYLEVAERFVPTEWRRGKAHSPRLKEGILKRYAAGESAIKLGEETGVRFETIFKWVKAAGLQRPKSRYPAEVRAEAMRLLKEGKSLRATAKAVNASLGIVKYWASKHD